MPITHLDADSFGDFVDGSTPVLVDFYAEYCPRSLAMAAVLDEVAAARPGLPVGKVNVDAEPDLANAYVVRTTPTVLVMKNGDIADRFTGETGADVLLDAVDREHTDTPAHETFRHPGYSPLHDYAPHASPRMYADPFSAPDPLTGLFF